MCRDAARRNTLYQTPEQPGSLATMTAATAAAAAVQQASPPPSPAPPPPLRQLPGPCAAAEVTALAQQYEAEAARLAERADLCGVRREHLSSAARLQLQLIAGIASALGLATSTPQLVLAAWAALVVARSRAAAAQQRLRQAVDAVSRERQAAQAQLARLQGVLADVVAKQRAGGLLAAEQARHTAALRDKAGEYGRLLARHSRKLAASGFTPEVTHAALLAKHARVAELQAALGGLQAQLAGYHHLPASKLGADMMLRQAQAQLREQQERLQAHLADMQ